MLATTTDLTARTGTDMAGDIRAEALIADASAAVISYTGQQFLAGTSTTTVKVIRGRARLPQRPVTNVLTVETLEGVSVPFQWYSGDTLTVDFSVPDLFSFVPFSSPQQEVVVTYDHGFDTVPSEIIAVVCQAAARAYGANAIDSGVSQETIGAYNYSTGAAASSGAVGFLLPERVILDRYLYGVRTIGVT